MENASKALIMAGSVLISLMVLGALMLMFNNVSTYQQTDRQTEQEAEVIKFNNQYETFNRKDVRGSDLYSLLNKAIDYNRRKSTKGTGNDVGQYIAYTPMVIKFKFNGSVNKLSVDSSGTTLITSNEYVVDEDNKNTFKSVYEHIKELEKNYGGQNTLNNLVLGFTKIFINNSNSYTGNDKEQNQAIQEYKNAGGIKKNDPEIWNEIKIGGATRKAVCEYYEYVQFKRAKFDCTGVNYDKKTGRIIEMTFEFTGKFE